MPTPDSLPLPYLDQEAVQTKMFTLGFEFYPPGHDLDGTLVDSAGGRQRLQALIDLIGGAIAEWADLKDDIRDEEKPGEVHTELQEWAEEWLVG